MSGSFFDFIQGQRVSKAGKAFALHVVDSGLTPGTPYGPLHMNLAHGVVYLQNKYAKPF